MIACSPRDLRLMGSNPTEVQGFFFFFFHEAELTSRSHLRESLSYGSQVRFFGLLKKSKMSYIEDGKTLSTREFSHRPRPSSLENRVLHSANCESLNQQN